jgi:hypothetical protein
VKQPKHASDFLKGILKDVGSKASRARFTAALEHALGPELAEHAHVTGFRGGRLYVEVDSAPLFAEWTGFRQEQIREACNDYLDKEKVAQIVFRMGGTGHA